MSYDIYLKIKTGENEYAYPYEDNYTYNVRAMFRKALGEEGLYSLHGMNANDAFEKLRTAIKSMLDSPEDYKKLNPKNGWGDYEGALRVLTELKDACNKHEYCTIEIC